MNDGIREHNLKWHKKYTIAISCGFSVYDPDIAPDVSLQALIEEADRMLLLEKDEKRSR